ncbi:flotillin-like protein FloA [Shouchella shacheensis]|uniref:flotillin-like protein FloA n=1 Tax=Shouchella shacheensis TaxID=1649580 RepID=UPI00073FFB1B|nr:flotillin-like protein FloA [Shouchella shacheensis]
MDTIDSTTIITLLVIAAAIVLLVVLFAFVPVGLWISAVSAKVKVGIFELVGMRLRRVIPRRVVTPLIKAVKAGLDLNTARLEGHYLAGGNVDRVVNALIAAQRANIELSFERAAAIDLAGRDVLEAVQMSVNPKVIETPFIAGVAMDGIEVKAKARITVRANIDRLVGGAGEDTIIARVGEGIVSTIGSSDDHKKVLENPDLISQTVLSKGLDSGTAFEILSIDIADIDIGKNIGAELQTDQAEADKKIAQAKAEERRAMAVAQEQEMRARVEEMRAKVVESEAEVPMALSEALRQGHMGVMDYMNYQNVVADTDMRDSISKASGEGKDNNYPEGDPRNRNN